MNRIVMLVLLAVPLALAFTVREDPRDEVWLTDLERATQVALESGKPLLVVFR